MSWAQHYDTCAAYLYCHTPFQEVGCLELFSCLVRLVLTALTLKATAYDCTHGFGATLLENGK